MSSKNRVKSAMKAVSRTSFKETTPYANDYCKSGGVGKKHSTGKYLELPKASCSADSCISESDHNSESSCCRSLDLSEAQEYDYSNEELFLKPMFKL